MRTRWIDLAAKFAADGVQVKLLNVSHAFHSPLMDEMLDEFEQFAAGIEFHAPQSAAGGESHRSADDEAPTARYWRDHLRNTVQFAEGMARDRRDAADHDHRDWPDGEPARHGPALRAAAWTPPGCRRCGRAGRLAGDRRQASRSIMSAAGRSIGAAGIGRGRGVGCCCRPIPFQRSRHWYTLDPSRRRMFAQDGAASAATATGGQSFIRCSGARLSTVWTNTLFETRLSARSPAYLADHQVQGSPVTPAAAYVEQGLAAAEQLFGPGRHGLANLVIQQAMFLPDGVAATRAGFGRAGVGRRVARSKCTAGRPMQRLHRPRGRCTRPARLFTNRNRRPAPTENSPSSSLERIDLVAVRGRAVGVTSHDDFYRRMAERGLAYGPAFQVLDELHPVHARCGGARRAAGIGGARGESLSPAPGARRRAIAIDGRRGAAARKMVRSARSRTCRSAFAASTSIRLVDDYSRPLYAYAVRTSSDAGPSPERVEGNVFLLDETGKVLVALEGVQVQRLGRSTPGGATAVDTSLAVPRGLARVAAHR